MNAASGYTESYKSCGKQVVFVMFLYSKCLKTKVGWISDPQKLFGFKKFRFQVLTHIFHQNVSEIWTLKSLDFRHLLSQTGAKKIQI